MDEQSPDADADQMYEDTIPFKIELKHILKKH